MAGTVDFKFPDFLQLKAQLFHGTRALCQLFSGGRALHGENRTAYLHIGGRQLQKDVEPCHSPGGGVIILLPAPCQVVVVSDSKYVTDAFNAHWVDSWIKKGWKRGKNEEVKNVDLWKRLLKAMEPHQVSFQWVKGHAGHPENERCDELATKAADGSQLMVDAGFCE